MAAPVVPAIFRLSSIAWLHRRTQRRDHLLQNRCFVFAFVYAAASALLLGSTGDILSVHQDCWGSPVLQFGPRAWVMHIDVFELRRQTHGLQGPLDDLPRGNNIGTLGKSEELNAGFVQDEVSFSPA